MQKWNIFNLKYYWKSDFLNQFHKPRSRVNSTPAQCSRHRKSTRGTWRTNEKSPTNETKPTGDDGDG